MAQYERGRRIYNDVITKSTPIARLIGTVSPSIIFNIKHNVCNVKQHEASPQTLDRDHRVIICAEATA